MTTKLHYLPLISGVYYVPTSLEVRFHRDEGVTVVTVEIGESHGSINDKRFFPQSLGPFRESVILFICKNLITSVFYTSFKKTLCF